jgi:hypothetical protein
LIEDAVPMRLVDQLTYAPGPARSTFLPSNKSAKRALKRL